MSATSRFAAGPIVRAECVWVAIASVGLAVLTSWPLVLHLGSQIRPDLGDPLRTAWQIAWAGHALGTDPLHIWNSNAFYPHAQSLLFSDSLLGFAPTALVGHGPTAALVRYNLLYLLAYALPFFGTYVLARELGVGRVGAVVAAAAFAYAPFRGDESGHLHVISSGGIPLSLFLLLRGYRHRSVRYVAAGWLVASCQLSLGFTLGLQLAYLLMALACIAVVAWLRHGSPALPHRLTVATLAGLLCFAVVGGVQARAYLKVANDYPTARRTVEEVKRYSAPPKAWLAAPAENRVWGAATAPVRHQLSSQNESSLFPGAVIALLSVVGLGSALYTRRLRAGLAILAVVGAVLALGFGLDGGRLTYQPLFDHLPGFDGIRTPGRLITMTTLSLALLGAAGAQRLIDLAAVSRWARGRWTRALPLAVGGLLALAVFAEGSSDLHNMRAPALPRAQVGLPGPILHLPTDPSDDRLYQFWSTEGFPLIANGNSTFDIPAQDDLRGAMQNFPDAVGVAKLRKLGFRTVVLHLDLEDVGLPAIHFSTPEPPNPQLAATRPITGLPLTRRRVGDLVIYSLAALPHRGRP
jgi:hypothetical protein